MADSSIYPVIYPDYSITGRSDVPSGPIGASGWSSGSVFDALTVADRPFAFVTSPGSVSVLPAFRRPIECGLHHVCRTCHPSAVGELVNLLDLFLSCRNVDPNRPLGCRL